MLKFLEQVQSDLGRPDSLEKIISFRSDPNHLHIRSRLVPHKGRIAIVTDAGRDAVDAGSVRRAMGSRGGLLSVSDLQHARRRR
jgi:hypothetical protein